MRKCDNDSQAVNPAPPQAAEELFPVVYDELRRLAARHLGNEQPGQTLQPTALVHEAYLKLASNESQRLWNSRSHFFAAAAIAIRRILVDRARAKKSLKRGGGAQKQEFAEQDLVTLPEPREDILALDEALNRLTETNPEAAQLVQLLYFSGLSRTEAAEVLGISTRTADRLWAFGRAWLRRELSDSSEAAENF